jgi:3-methyladenine DNA glycosylase AlkD
VTPDGFVERVRIELRVLADPARAPGMQAYMKSALPYLGVPVPLVRATVRRLLRESAEPVESRQAWERVIRRLFDEAVFREERYAGLAVAGGSFSARYQDGPSLPLYEHLVVEGAWWDIVDDVSHRVGDVLRADRKPTTACVLRWSRADDLWLRRCSIICQLGHHLQTDQDLLTQVIDANLEDRRFFVRKAIGWALRDYARTDPTWVLDFVASREDRMSPLSRREALKHVPRPSEPTPAAGHAI